MASPGYMFDLGQAAFGPGPIGAPAQPMMLGQAAPVPPPVDAAPPVAVGPPAPPPQSFAAHEDPAKAMLVMPAPAPGPVQSNPPPPTGRAPAATPQLVGGGIRPAHEVDLRGPSLQKAQERQNSSYLQAILGGLDTQKAQAANEYGTYLDQERSARMRENAATQSVLERDDELAARQADFDQSVKQLSKMSLNPDRFWASRNTGQKIASVISIALGGFMQGMKGGSNPGLDIINSYIDRDIKAQEFAYGAARDAAQAKQTAFGLAMQKYNNVDAARAAARAAALDSAAAQTAKLAATNKSLGAEQHAANLLAQFDEQRAGQIASGIRYVLPTANEVRVKIPGRLGTYSMAEYHKMLETEEGRNFELVKQDEAGKTTLQGKLIEQGSKGKDKLGEETRFIADKLHTAGVPQARAAAEAALAALNKSPGGTGEKFARGVLGDGDAANAVMSDDANAREQAYWAYANAAMKAMMGNVTEGEFERAKKQFGSAADPKSRERAIRASLVTLEGIEKGVKAGVSPEAQRKYDEQRLNAEGAPALLPQSATKGWSE